MPYAAIFYPEFSDLKVFHADGFSPTVVLDKVLDFLNDPAHAHYRFICSHVDYMQPNLQHFPKNSPECDFWVEVTILYTE